MSRSSARNWEPAGTSSIIFSFVRPGFKRSRLRWPITVRSNQLRLPDSISSLTISAARNPGATDLRSTGSRRGALQSEPRPVGVIWTCLFHWQRRLYGRPR